MKTPWQWKDLTAKIRDEGFVPCPVCHGTKQDVLTRRIECPDCCGTKKKLYNNELHTECRRCDVDGTIFDAVWITCPFCKGTGVREWTDKILRPVPVQYVEEREEL